MKHLRFSLANNWYLVLIGTLSLSAAVLVLTYRLGSLTGGLSPSEFSLWQTVYVEGLSLLDIFRDSAFLPYQLGLWILQYMPFHGNGSLRIIGVLFGLIGVVGFFELLRRWYSIRVAFFGATLFLCSSWLLHTTRFASAESMYAATAILLALWAWVLSGRFRRAALLLFVVAAMFALYVPGAPWLLIPALVWQRRNLSKAFQHVSLGFSILTLALAILLLIPLIVTVAWPLQGTSLDALRAFFGIPAQLPSPLQFMTNVINIPKELFLASRGNPTIHLARLPLLDAFATAMFVVGAYVYSRDWRLDRTRFIFAGLVGGSLLIGLGGVSMAVLLPFVYLVIVGGASYLLQEWLRVFPRNPFARWLGVSLIAVTVTAAIIYQLTNYFVAWPDAPATKTTFSRRI